MIRLLLVDDHTVLRDALAVLLNLEPDLEVVARAASLSEARPALVAVDLALVDLELPDGSGSELIGELKRVNPAAAALVLTGHTSREEHARAIEAGAAGVLHKGAEIKQVTAAVRAVAAGDTIITQAELIELLRLAARERQRSQQVQQLVAAITPREREILATIVAGLSEKEIARALSISPNTVRNHVVSLMTKLGAHSRLQAALLAVRYGVVPLEQVEAPLRGQSAPTRVD